MTIFELLGSEPGVLTAFGAALMLFARSMRNRPQPKAAPTLIRTPRMAAELKSL